MDIGEFFNNLGDKFNELKEKFKDVVGEFTEVEYRQNIGNSVAALFIAAIVIHIFDVLMGFNRSSLGPLFFVMYFLFASAFYFATLPGKIVLGNLAVALGLSFASFYAPYLIILISKYFPMVLIFLVFTPIWPMYILFTFYEDSDVLRGIGFTISILWTVAFLAYFYNHFPTQAKNVFYERAVDVKEPAWELIKNVYTNIVDAGVKIYNDINNGISNSINSFMDQMISVAMGETETQETKQVQPQEKQGIYIENVYLTLDENPQVFFTVSAYNLIQKINASVECYAKLEKKEKEDEDEKDVSHEKVEKTEVYGLESKGKREKEIKGKVFSLTHEDFKGKITLWHDQVEDFRCVLPKNLAPGEYKAIVKVKFNETATTSLPVYLISFKMYSKIRAQGKDFFTLYNLPTPRAQQNLPTAAIIKLGFKSQPLIEATPNTLLINVVKSEKWQEGEIEKFNSLIINLKKLKNYIASIKGIKIKNPIPSTEETVFEIPKDVMNKFSKSFEAKFLITPKRIDKELISSDFIVSTNYEYLINTEQKFKVLNIVAGTLVDNKEDKKTTS